MRKTRRRNRIANINVIPYLDVMLVLLVIFMATAPLFNLSAVKPAELARNTAEPGKAGLLVSYPLDGPFLVINPTTGEEIPFFDEDAVVDHFKGECFLNRERPIMLVGDREQGHNEVMGLYSRIKSEAGCGGAVIGVVEQ